MKLNYVQVRKEQLVEERDKNTNEYDRQWYNRLINELSWAENMLIGTAKENCILQMEE